MSDVITICPVFGGACPRAQVRPARLVEETVVHCERCGAELKVGKDGALPKCICGAVER